MIRENYYTGEPVAMPGSPSSSSFSSESEAAAMANFGSYNYDSNDRCYVPPQPIQQPTFQWNGNFQPNVGIGMPYYYPGYQQPQYSQYGNVLPYNRPFQQQFQTPYYPQPATYHISGYNPSGTEYLPSINFQEEIEQLEKEYWEAIAEVDAKDEMQQQQSVYGSGMYGLNYYGSPYMGSYKYNSVNNQFAEKIDKMKKRARDNRIKLNIQLSKLCHNIAGDGLTEEEIVQRCVGRDIEVPQITPKVAQSNYLNMKLNNLVPFDNSGYYNNIRIQHMKELEQLFPEKCDMNQMFKCLGELSLKYEMEEEMQRRRDLSNDFSVNAYSRLIKRRIKEREAEKQDIKNTIKTIDTILNSGCNYNYNQFNQAFGNRILQELPTLSQNATISDDGTLNVSLQLPVNVGDHRGEIYTVDNQNSRTDRINQIESEYGRKREKFAKFLAAIKTNGDPHLEQLKQEELEKATKELEAEKQEELSKISRELII